MGWLRIHDGFTANGKIAQLTNAEFRVWMRLLCHCANSRDPSVDTSAKREVNGLNSARVARFKSLQLLDQVGEDFEIHDWVKYMPKEEQNASRQAAWRARRRNASRNGSDNAQTVTERNAPRNTSPSRTRAGTRGSPSRPVEEPSLHPSESRAARATDGWMDEHARINRTDIEAALRGAT